MESRLVGPEMHKVGLDAMNKMTLVNVERCDRMVDLCEMKKIRAIS
jgi:hypothetical protein